MGLHHTWNCLLPARRIRNPRRCVNIYNLEGQRQSHHSIGPHLYTHTYTHENTFYIYINTCMCVYSSFSFIMKLCQKWRVHTKKSITWYKNVKWGTSLVVQWLRLRAPNAGSLGSIPGQGTRSHTLQLRVCMVQLKTPHAATKDSACPN